MKERVNGGFAFWPAKQIELKLKLNGSLLINSLTSADNDLLRHSTRYLRYHRLREYCCYCKQINRTSTRTQVIISRLMEQLYVYNVRIIRCKYIVHFSLVAFFSTKFQVRYGTERTERKRERKTEFESKWIQRQTIKYNWKNSPTHKTFHSQ